MAKEQLKINIELKDIELIKNLVELLEMHFENLPTDLQFKLMQIEETGLNDFTADDFRSMFPDMDYEKVECTYPRTVKINKLLKKVVVINGYTDRGEETLYPEHFYLRYDGKTIIEW